MFKLPVRFIIGMSTLSLVTSIAMAAVPPYPMTTPSYGNVYIGAFGGWGSSDNFDVRQSGVAFFTTPPLLTPLPVDATGDASFSTGFGGIHIGYEWITPHYKDTLWTWAVVPALEVEGIYFSHDIDSQVVNVNPRLGFHTFDDSFSAQGGLVLINGVLSFNHINSAWHPYIGLGLGAAILSLSSADSLQVVPPEPLVNHFNSGTSDDDWTFAAQAKAGLRYNISQNFRIFAEYRYLYMGNTNFTFGATRYPTHVETTSWEVDMDSISLNSGAIGIEFSFA